ncbi:TniQ family protein [Pseudomonas sp. PDM18]|uniref:TniQ domain-containing protein n=1 Tax=Pseudomonas nitroreducens TaxID=46680 RepID=A0A5R8ZV93_PSENT|nr:MULTISPECIES: TniQ family protein [Pseudomonas]MBD9679487.1 TniQ family protein [Pseudomonas sp. PDM18]TLP69610.1 hypothetical protein FEA48_29425 [Pseudomonas nitroreducens]
MSPIGFFPSPLPDESFESLIYRYTHLQCVVTSQGFREVICVLFGMNKSPASLGKADLLYFSNRVSNSDLGFFEELLRCHSYYFLLSSFSFVDELKMVRSNLPSAHVEERVTTGAFFERKYCPLCLDSDIEDFGAAYWHRAHQCPGVSCCWKHSVELMALDYVRLSEFSFSKSYAKLVQSPREIKYVSCAARLRYAKFFKVILDCNLVGLDISVLERVLDYYLWSRRCILNECCIVSRVKELDGYNDISRRLLHYEFHGPVLFSLGKVGDLELLICYLSTVFDVEDFLRLCSSGLLEGLEAGYDVLCRTYPAINWQWVFKRELICAKPGAYSAFLISEIERFDRDWCLRFFDIVEADKKRPGLVLMSFCFREIYISQ